MSNHLAIATVTATLRNLVQTAINADVSGATVSTVRPTADAEGLTAFGVNIFLYQAVPNTAWRNADLPTRNPAGGLVQRPVMPLDLHYLLTFHGSDSTLDSQRLLGSTVRAIHSRPLLTGDMIRATLEAAEAEDPAHVLLNSDLADEVERVKFTRLPFNLEELSKLWSVMLQTPYVLSMGYLASVVLIEADEMPRRPLPVRQRVIGVAPFQRARIESVESTLGESEAVRIGDTIAIRGSQLGGPIERVRVGVAGALTPVAGAVSPTEVRVALTDPTIRSGVVGVQIVYAGGSTSNVAPLVLRPRIAQDAGDNYEISVVDLETDADGTHSATIEVVLEPEIDPQQRVELYLNAFRPVPGPGAAFRVDAVEREATTDTVAFPISGVPSGTYLLRVQVNGAETTLDLEDEEADPNFGFYVEPAVTLP
jgi:hypothetical protein